MHVSRRESYTPVVKEIIALSFTPWTVAITVILGFCILYWMLNVIGLIDLDVLDLDLDTDIDTEAAEGGLAHGILGSILRFMNASDVPLMIILTILFLLLWMINVIGNALLGTGGDGFLAGVVFFAAFIASVILVKFITMPLRPVFRAMQSGGNDDEPIFGKEAVVVSLNLDEKGGQVEVARSNGAPALLSARLTAGEVLLRGQHAVIFDRDPDTGTYLARPIEPNIS